MTGMGLFRFLELIMQKDADSGHQLDSHSLYERQKAKVYESEFNLGPVIIAEGIRTPENIGGILRLADAAGSNKVIFIGDDISASLSSKKTSRIARGTGEHIEVSTMALSELSSRIHSYGPLIAIEITDKSDSLFDVKFPDKFSLVVGSERHGISEKMLGLCAQAIHIPMFGKNGSMNVSHALAICLFEWRRQQVS